MGRVSVVQRINVADDKWQVVIVYGVDEGDLPLLKEILRELHCTDAQIERACRVILHVNTGFTFSCLECRKSLVAIGRTTDDAELINTITHEVNHLKAAICKAYAVTDRDEAASYLVGFLNTEIYKFLIRYGKTGKSINV